MYFLSKPQFLSFQDKKTMKIVLASVFLPCIHCKRTVGLFLIILDYNKRNSPLFPKKPKRFKNRSPKRLRYPFQINSLTLINLRIINTEKETN